MCNSSESYFCFSQKARLIESDNPTQWSRHWSFRHAQVASLTVGPEYNSHFESLFKFFMGQLQSVLPPGTDIVAAYRSGTDDEQAFVQDLALFFTSFFRVGCAVRTALKSLTRTAINHAIMRTLHPKPLAATATTTSRPSFWKRSRNIPTPCRTAAISCPVASHLTLLHDGLHTVLPSGLEFINIRVVGGKAGAADASEA